MMSIRREIGQEKSRNKTSYDYYNYYKLRVTAVKHCEQNMQKRSQTIFSNFRQQNCNPIMAISLQKPEYKNSSNTHI